MKQTLLNETNIYNTTELFIRKKENYVNSKQQTRFVLFEKKGKKRGLTERIGKADCHLLNRVHGPVIAILIDEAGQQGDQSCVRHPDTQTHPQMRDYQLRHRAGGRYQNGADPDQQHGQNGDFATPVAISYHAEEIRPDEVSHAVRDEHRPQLPFLQKLLDYYIEYIEN